MTKEPIYSRQAQSDLEDIFDFVATDNPRRARSYIEEIMTSCQGLCDTPFMDVARPDLQHDLRIYTFRGRVVIAYRILPNQLEILRVFANGRDYEVLMGDINNYR